MTGVHSRSPNLLKPQAQSQLSALALLDKLKSDRAGPGPHMASILHYEIIHSPTLRTYRPRLVCFFTYTSRSHYNYFCCVEQEQEVRVANREMYDSLKAWFEPVPLPNSNLVWVPTWYPQRVWLMLPYGHRLLCRFQIRSGEFLF
jgi:hypothetical protein